MRQGYGVMRLPVLKMVLRSMMTITWQRQRQQQKVRYNEYDNTISIAIELNGVYPHYKFIFSRTPYRMLQVFLCHGIY